MTFQDAIQGDWGGRPYQDIVLGLAHLEDKHSYIDTSRAAAIGASYGGYMVNYIQGKPLGRKFKALITHDGVMDIPGAWAADELYFVHHEFRGTPWDNPEGFQRWSPLKHAEHWATPHLIIHGTEDFRCLISDAMMAFNILQTKQIDSKLVIFPGEGHVSSPLHPRPRSCSPCFPESSTRLEVMLTVQVGAQPRKLISVA